MSMLEEYRNHVAEREASGLVPQPLTAEWTSQLVELIKSPIKGEEGFLLDLLAHRVPAGVDEAAYVKAGFLAAIAKGETQSPILSAENAVELLGTMLVDTTFHPWSIFWITQRSQVRPKRH